MRLLRLPLLCFFALATAQLFAQQPALHFKLQLLPGGERWGVFVKPDSTISPSGSTVTGSGQVTVVMPKNYPWSNLVHHAGTWNSDSNVHGPVENPGRSYVSFGMVGEFPNPITYASGTETLLFSFKKASWCPDTLYLFENGADPFEAPNSLGSNPGNELSVVDFGASPFQFYSYKGNYAPGAWNCNSQNQDCTGSLLSIQNQPVSLNLCSGNSASFSVTVANAGASDITCAWEVSTDNGITWTNISTTVESGSTTTPSLFLVNVTGMNGRQYRLRAQTPNCPPIFSETALLTVAQPIAVTVNAQPQNATGCPGNAATFVCSFSDAGNSPMQLTWQKSADDGQTWNNIAADPNIFGSVEGMATGNGSFSDTLLVFNTTGLENVRYRLAFQRPGCPADYFSQSAAFHLQSPLTFSKQPGDFSACVNGSALFTAEVAEAQNDIAWKWQSSADQGSTWADLDLSGSQFSHTAGNQVDTLRIANIAGLTGYRFRALAQPAGCPTATSASARLDLTGNLSFATQPTDLTACPNDGATFIANIDNQGFSAAKYVWQVSKNGGASWQNAQGETGFGGTYEGGKTNQLHVSLTDGLDGYLYRLKAALDNCAASFSQAAALRVESDPACFPSGLDGDCLYLEVKTMPDGVSWGVFAHAGSDFDLSDLTETTQGEVTLVAPKDFEYILFESHAGNWLPFAGNVSPAENPEMVYYHFALLESAPGMTYQKDEPLLLFSFTQASFCPDTLYLIEQNDPAPFYQNRLNGYDNVSGEPFQLCGNYRRNAARCGSDVPVALNLNAGAAAPAVAASVERLQPASDPAVRGASLRLSPNPAVNEALVKVETSGGAMLRLVNMQGAVLRQTTLPAGEQSLQLDLTQAPKGTYFLVLTAGGKMLWREVLIRN